MNPDEQWEVINVANFDTALFGKIKGVRSAMANAEIETDEIRTNVQDVPIKWAKQGDLLLISVGEDNQGKPLSSLTIPAIWTEA